MRVHLLNEIAQWPEVDYRLQKRAKKPVIPASLTLKDFFSRDQPLCMYNSVNITQTDTVDINTFQLTASFDVPLFL